MEVEYRFQAASKIRMILGVLLIDAVDGSSTGTRLEGGMLLSPYDRRAPILQTITIGSVQNLSHF